MPSRVPDMNMLSDWWANVRALIVFRKSSWGAFFRDINGVRVGMSQHLMFEETQPEINFELFSETERQRIQSA